MTQTKESSTKTRMPPRWFMKAFWHTHRWVYRVTRGRFGLWRPGRRLGWGAMCVHAVGRRSGQPRDVMVGYFEDGPNAVALAMNGWQDGEPAWWLNVQAHPDIDVDLPDGSRQVTVHAARGEERDRLWTRWCEIDKNLDAYAARRSVPTGVAVFAPRGTPAGDGGPTDPN